MIAPPTLAGWKSGIGGRSARGSIARMTEIDNLRNAPSPLCLPVRFAVYPCVQPSEFHATFSELAAAPHFHTTHLPGSIVQSTPPTNRGFSHELENLEVLPILRTKKQHA